jgi:hypothetical protein
VLRFQLVASRRRLSRYVYNPFRMNNFHGISSGNPHPISLKLKFGKARNKRFSFAGKLSDQTEKSSINSVCKEGWARSHRPGRYMIADTAQAAHHAFGILLLVLPLDLDAKRDPPLRDGDVQLLDRHECIPFQGSDGVHSTHPYTLPRRILPPLDALEPSDRVTKMCYDTPTIHADNLWKGQSLSMETCYGHQIWSH